MKEIHKLIVITFSFGLMYDPRTLEKQRNTKKIERPVYGGLIFD